MIKKINGKLIHYSKEIQELCGCPYPGKDHEHGCPKYNKCPDCPPNAPLIDKVLDLNKPIYVIITDFKIGKHVRKMWKKHPKWSVWQAYCCLYWQSKAKKMHQQNIEKYKKQKNLSIVDNYPEGHGVNINGLLVKLGIKLEWITKDADKLPRNKLPQTTRRVSLAQ